MPTFVAIEQTKSSLVIAVAERNATGVSLTQGACLDLPAKADPAEVERQLRAALPEVRWSKANLVVVVGGEETQLRRFDLPPAPAEELPLLVRMMSGKELAATEGDAIDFLPLQEGDHGNTVVAARLAEARLAEVEALAKRLDASLLSIVHRACASASLVKRLVPEVASGQRLVVAPSGDGADLVAFKDGKPVLVRSMRGGGADALKNDIRRTLPVASQLLEGAPTSITVLGEPAGESVLETAYGEVSIIALDLAVESVTGSVLSGQSQAEWAPLVGVIGASLEAAGGGRPDLDFANPREAEAGPSDNRRQFVLAGLAVAAVLAGVLMAYGRLVSMDREIADLRSAAERFDESAETLRPYQEQVAKLDAWAADDVTWLDEFEQLGRRLRPQALNEEAYPVENDVFLTELWMRPPANADKGGRIDLRAAARKASILGELENRLRDDGHEVQPISVSERPNGGDYPWSFKTLIRVSDAGVVEQETPAEEGQGGSDE